MVTEMAIIGHKYLRIKPYLHILQHGGVIEFTKTLDDIVRMPAGSFFNTFLESIRKYPGEIELTERLSFELKLPPGAAVQVIDSMLKAGVVEYYPGEDVKPGRYHRQLLLFDSISPKNDFSANEASQQKLKETHVMIAGIGGIGNFIALALAAAGVGKISLVDFDTVEETNLNRQVLFGEQHIGKSKTDSAAKRLRELNASVEINCYEKEITGPDSLNELLEASGNPQYLVLSADKPVELVLWASALCKKHGFKYIKCGYMTYQGLIGPLLGPDTKKYEELFKSWAANINSQDTEIRQHNNSHIAASMAATNAVLANIAAFEMIKDITGIVPSVLTEKRLLLNFKTMELTHG